MTRQVLLPLLSLQNINTFWTSYVHTKEFRWFRMLYQSRKQIYIYSGCLSEMKILMALVGEGRGQAGTLLYYISQVIWVSKYDDRHRNPNINIREIIWLGNQLWAGWQATPMEEEERARWDVFKCYHEAEAKIFEMASNCFYRQPEVDNTGLDFIRLTLYVTNRNQVKVCKTCKMAIGCKTLWTEDFLTGI